METFLKDRPVLAGILIIGASILISFFILQKGSSPAPSPSPTDLFNDQIENQPSVVMDMSVEEIMNSPLRLYISLTDDEQLTTDLGDVAGTKSIQLENGKQDVFFCEQPYRVLMVDDEPCREDFSLVGKGSIALSHIQRIKEGDFANDTFAIMTLVKDAQVIPFLVHISSDELAGIRIWEAQRLPAGIQIKDVTITSTGIITIAQVGSAETLSFEWGDRTPRYSDGELSPLTPDLKNVVVTSTAAGIRFSYPKEFKPAYRYGDLGRSYSAQEKSGLAAVYYTSACGVQNTFADYFFPFRIDGDENSMLQANLTSHKITADIMYLTTARYGYNPLEWDMIIGTQSMLQYAKEIQSGAVIAGREVTLMKIDDQPIRHIAPYKTARPCDVAQYEQYQWIQDGFLFNLVIEHPVDRLYDSALIHELLAQLVRSIEPVATE